MDLCDLVIERTHMIKVRSSPNCGGVARDGMLLETNRSVPKDEIWLYDDGGKRIARLKVVSVS